MNDDDAADDDDDDERSVTYQLVLPSFAQNPFSPAAELSTSPCAKIIIKVANV